MSYEETIGTLGGDAERLETIYHEARQAGEADAFKQAIDTHYRSAPENLLLAAWFYRLQRSAAQAKERVIAWAWVIPLALLNGLLLWGISAEQFTVTIAGFRNIDNNFMPAVVLLAAPVSAAMVLFYFTVVGQKNWGRGTLAGLVPLAAGAYVLWIYPQTGTRPFQEQYLTLMVLHLFLLSWATVGGFLIFEHRDAPSRFAFLIKSLEIAIVAGLFVIAGGLFTGITAGLFAALDVPFPELVIRLFLAGGGGLIPVIATAILYNPQAPPAAQAFDEGLSKLIALLMRILLPLTLLVLVVYLAFIPFNFRAPFDNRDVLIIYNGMLFAVVALLVGATPISRAQIGPDQARWLRRAIIGVAGLTLLVSVYALAAILYRTYIDRLTPNRLTFIGWNVINISLLGLILLFQIRTPARRWLAALYRAYSAGTVAYAVWALLLLVGLPWLFGSSYDADVVDDLPLSVQALIYDQPAPILLKCNDSPHIYLLEAGQKRWIDTIATFDARGYVWRDIHFISCADLRQVPAGVPIPAGAGPPPEP